MELSLFSKKIAETPYATFHEKSELLRSLIRMKRLYIDLTRFYSSEARNKTAGRSNTKVYNWIAWLLWQMRDPKHRSGFVKVKALTLPPAANRTRILVRWTREARENPGHGRNPSQDLQSMHLRLQARGRIPKVAVILKYCFPCGESPRAVKTGHWKGCHGPERRLKQCVGSKARDRKRRSDAQPE